MTLVIMRPDEEPGQKSLAGAALYSDMAYLTILESPVLSPPPSCINDSGLAIS